MAPKQSPAVVVFCYNPLCPNRHPSDSPVRVDELEFFALYQTCPRLLRGTDNGFAQCRHPTDAIRLTEALTV